MDFERNCQKNAFVITSDYEKAIFVLRGYEFGRIGLVNYILPNRFKYMSGKEKILSYERNTFVLLRYTKTNKNRPDKVITIRFLNPPLPHATDYTWPFANHAVLWFRARCYVGGPLGPASRTTSGTFSKFFYFFFFYTQMSLGTLRRTTFAYFLAVFRERNSNGPQA